MLLPNIKKIPIIATRDWHPPKTKHFKKFGGIWPAHCVQSTKGARFHPKLNLPENSIILSKGMNPESDSYSAFDAENDEGVNLVSLLQILRVLDALKKGFRVGLLVDAVKGVNLKQDDSSNAVKAMLDQGAEEVTFKKFSSKLETGI